MNIFIMHQGKINCILNTNASLLVNIKGFKNSTNLLRTKLSRNFFEHFLKLMNGESGVNLPLSHHNSNVSEFKLFLFKNDINLTQLFSSVIIHVQKNRVTSNTSFLVH